MWEPQERNCYQALATSIVTSDTTGKAMRIICSRTSVSCDGGAVVKFSRFHATAACSAH